MNVTVQVRGIEALKRELARLSATTAARLSKNAAMAGARVAARRAKAIAPVESGKLRASIKAFRPPQGQLGGQRVALAGSRLFYSRFVELGTSRQPARSFLRRAVDEGAAEIHEKVRANLQAGIDRTIAKQTPPEDVGDL